VFGLFTGRDCWGSRVPAAPAGEIGSGRVELLRHRLAGQMTPVSNQEPGPPVSVRPRRKCAEEVSPGLSVQSSEEVRDWSVTGPKASDVILADVRVSRGQEWSRTSTQPWVAGTS
jgi:hypothetical protein